MIVKLLLTSGGITNASSRAALVELLGRPIEESRALVIPTAQWGHPMCSPESVWRTVAGRWGGEAGFVDLGWKSVGVLELLALPTMSEELWMPWVREADVLLVDGGEAVYLAHWLRESGLAAMLPSLSDTVWVGVSAGSMVLTPRIGPESSGGGRMPVTRRSASWTSRSSRTWTIRAGRRTRRRARAGGPRGSAARRTRLTTRRLSRSTAARCA